jgi:SAM-dependent methyltransferase
MKPGPMIRKMLGPLERPIGDAYRGLYIDLNDFAALILQWKPTAERILEVGCGEGAVTQRLAVAYPRASITAIDISPRVGRMYAGPRGRVAFVQCTAEQAAAAEPHRYDLVVLSDVVHHVPQAARQSLLESIGTALAPGGSFIFKDWEKNRTPIHWMCYASDRWLTGDRIEYMSRQQMRDYLARTFGEPALVAERRVRPRWNNLATLVKP